jgi:hydroxymethylbilane synthase
VPSKRVIIGTRGSQLALVQARYIAAELRRHYPEIEVEERIISTKGDRILDVALSAVGDKGLFVKEIEVALARGEIDVAVHSGKDLPSIIPEELLLVAFPKRVDPRDVIILPQGTPTTKDAATTPLDVLPPGAKLGTSSLRRACQIRALRPDLQILDVRGNVDTRLRKLDSGEYDAIVLAAAGLERLGLGDRISQPLSIETLLPAVAQGALIIETRADDTETNTLLAVLDDRASRLAVLAEREFLRRLEGGCQVPIAAYAHVDETNENIYLRGLVGALDGSVIVSGRRAASLECSDSLGTSLAEELLQRGAEEILADLRKQAES